MARKKTAGTAGTTFEEALARLEAIVRELEETDLPLERSLEVFEEGVRLSRSLHERLNEAERKVEVLMKNGDGEKVAVPFPQGAGAEAGVVEEAAADDGSDEAEEGDDDEGDGDGGGGAGHGQRTLF